MDKHSARYCAQWLPGCTFLFTRFADRNIVARARNIKRKRGKDITHRERRGKFAWLFYAPRTKHFNVGLERKHRERERWRGSPTTSRQLHLAFPLSRLFTIYQSRLPLVITTGPNLHAKLRITSRPFTSSGLIHAVKTSKRLSTLILDLSFLFF